MRNVYRLAASICLSVLVLSIFAVRPAVVRAQDASPVVCDSTLVTLLLVAEHDYDYLSNMMDNGGIPNVDLGQFDHLIHDTIAMMQSMEMSAEEMATMEAMQAQLDEMMAMSTTDMLHSYDMSMAMGTEEPMAMTSLEPGNVAGENDLCTTVRADVEKFIVAHIIADTESMGHM